MVVLHRTSERIGAALAAAALPALLIYLLIHGLARPAAVPGVPEIQLIAIAPELPPPPPEPRPARIARREGAAAPANREARPETAAPVPQPAPPPPIALPGPDRSAGAAAVPGPGTGAGGQGNGTGAGGAGDGEGGGGGTPLRWIKGRIKDSDYPRAALRRGASGTVGLRFTVGVKGRVTGCAVTRSSGDADLDATTCRLIVERFRYEPSRDAQGRAVPDTVEGEHEWVLWRRGDAPDPE